jgi:hypothetical protein
MVVDGEVFRNPLVYAYLWNKPEMIDYLMKLKNHEPISEPAAPKPKK